MFDSIYNKHIQLPLVRSSLKWKFLSYLEYFSLAMHLWWCNAQQKVTVERSFFSYGHIQNIYNKCVCMLQQRSSGIGWVECSAKACTDIATIWIVEPHIIAIPMALSTHGNHHNEEVRNNWIVWSERKLFPVISTEIHKLKNWMLIWDAFWKMVIRKLWEVFCVESKLSIRLQK